MEQLIFTSRFESWPHNPFGLACRGKLLLLKMELGLFFVHITNLARFSKTQGKTHSKVIFLCLIEFCKVTPESTQFSKFSDAILQNLHNYQRLHHKRPFITWTNPFHFYCTFRSKYPVSRQYMVRIQGKSLSNPIQRIKLSDTNGVVPSSLLHQSQIALQKARK